MFRKLEAIVNEEEVEVHWRYEDDDEDMLDAGQIFSELTQAEVQDDWRKLSQFYPLSLLFIEKLQGNVSFVENLIVRKKLRMYVVYR